MEKHRLFSILESVFFVNSQPISLDQLKTVLDEKLSNKELKKILKEFSDSYNENFRGVYLEQTGGGWHMRTKTENRDYLTKMTKKRPFKLSQPALEALATIVYNQPCPKQQVDEIRGTDSGHLFRTLIELGLVCFAGKSDRPGKPSLYKTTNKFLTVFGFNSLEDLPSKEEINKLIPQTESTPKLENENFPKPSPVSFEEDEKERRQIDDALKNIKTNVHLSKESARHSG